MFENQQQENQQQENQQQENQQQPQQRSDKKSRPKKYKGFMSNIAAAVIGSVLTLTVASQLDINNLSATASNGASNADQPVASVQAVPTAASSGTVADTVESVSKAIVGVENVQQQSQFGYNQSQMVETGSGSGVIFKKEGDSAFIVTNNHVVEGAKEINISLYNGEKTTARLVGADALTDLAVLEIDAKYVDTVVQFGDSSTLRPGDQVWAIGNPLGLDLSRTVTQGIVSAVDRSIPVSTSAGEWELNVIQTDAAINPGNSGGALINASGQVVGINSMKIAQSGVEGLGFAIPANDLIPIVNQIIETGKVVRPYMGVSLANLEEVPRVYLQDLPNDVTTGVMIMQIDPNSAASRAGLQIQDVIVSLNGEKISNAAELRKSLYSKLKVGDEATVEYYRQGQLKTATLQLTSNQQDLQ
ncbi:trypsin-like peptidase domain-containing protein [Bacillaceae bacterium Marseille-Q3522]|nr:trypsin-like peptidase domain-containing protein [Bacillaceae bacterium Marseille-Q3522]